MKQSNKLGLSLVFATTILSTGCSTIGAGRNFLDDSQNYDREIGVTFDTKSGQPIAPEATWNASCLEAKKLEKDLIVEAKKGYAEQQISRVKGKEGIEYAKGAFESVFKTLKNKATRSGTTIQFENSSDACVQGIAFTEAKKGGFACEFNRAFQTVTVAGLGGSEGMPIEPKSIIDCKTEKTSQKHIKSLQRNANFKTGKYSPNNPNCKFCK